MKPQSHRDEIAALRAARFRGEAEQEDAEQRPVGVAENAEHDGDDARVRRVDDDRGRDRADRREEQREDHRAPAHGAHGGRARLAPLAEVRHPEILREAGRERIERRAERAHRRGQHARDEQAARAGREVDAGCSRRKSPGSSASRILGSGCT